MSGLFFSAISLRAVPFCQEFSSFEQALSASPNKSPEVFYSLLNVEFDVAGHHYPIGEPRWY